MILDDDEDILEMFTELLTEEGCITHCYSHTDDIFKLIEKTKPSHIIIDYLLNGINGGELCAQIKKSLDTSLIPVMLISGFEKVMKSLGDYNCDVFLPKPIDAQSLLTFIKSKKHATIC